MVLVGVRKHTFLELAEHQMLRKRISQAQAVAETGCTSLAAKVYAASEAKAEEWKACQKLCRFAPSVDELALDPASRTVTIDLARMCEVQRDNCMLLPKLAMMGAG